MEPGNGAPISSKRVPDPHHHHPPSNGKACRWLPSRWTNDAHPYNSSRLLIRLPFAPRLIPLPCQPKRACSHPPSHSPHRTASTARCRPRLSPTRNFFHLSRLRLARRGRSPSLTSRRSVHNNTCLHLRPILSHCHLPIPNCCRRGPQLHPLSLPTPEQPHNGIHPRSILLLYPRPRPHMFLDLTLNLRTQSTLTPRLRDRVAGAV